MSTRNPAEDFIEIQRLYVDYGRHADHQDFAAFGALFAKQGKARIHIRGDGPEEIEAAMKASAGDRPAFGAMHLIGIPRIDLDGDRASGEAMWALIAPDADGTLRITSIGRHIDELVFEDGHWRFALRRGAIDLSSS